jgi:hypothetical protein
LGEGGKAMLAAATRRRFMCGQKWGCICRRVVVALMLYIIIMFRVYMNSYLITKLLKTNEYEMRAFAL